MKFTDNPGVAMDARAFSYGATVKPGAAPVLGGLAVEVNATPPVADPHVFSEPRPVLPAGEFRWGVKDGVMDPRVRVEREAPALGTGNLLAEASRKPPVIGLERQLAIDPPARWMPPSRSGTATATAAPTFRGRRRFTSA